MVIPIRSQLNLSVCPVQETHDSWRMTVGFHQLSQIASATPDVVSLCEQMNTSPHTWCAAIDLANVSFPTIRPPEKQLPFSWQDLSPSYLRGTSTLQPYVII